jgi:Domain of unknown function (DUF5753)
VVTGGTVRGPRWLAVLVTSPAYFARSHKHGRIETGRVKIAQPDLQILLDLYEVTDETRASLLTLARQATHRGWWRSYSDALPAWFENYVGLENGAKSLFTYQNQLVHGLMQTEEYATAIFAAHQPALSADEVERRLATRATRQALLTAASPLHVWAVLDEAVLRPSGIGVRPRALSGVHRPGGQRHDVTRTRKDGAGCALPTCPAPRGARAATAMRPEAASRSRC